ncbi:hypothetical protein VYU27_010362 [Nannochloropsis oceanica]
MTLPCDAVLITGHAILSEAMLTGEAAPVMKASLPPADTTSFNPTSEREKKYLLFSGTKVLQARCGPPPLSYDRPAAPIQEAAYVWDTLRRRPPHLFPASSGSSFHLSDAQGNDTDLLVHTRPIPIAMVLHTGFTTARGQLVRAILFPPPPKFDFEAQGYKFIWVLASTLVVGAILQIVIYIRFPSRVSSPRASSARTPALWPRLVMREGGRKEGREGGREGGEDLLPPLHRRN